MAETLRPVEGWASGALCVNNESKKSVVIGPDATPAGLLSWGIGQLQQLTVLVDAIACSEDAIGRLEPPQVCGAIKHQLSQIDSTLVAAAEMLAAERRARGGAA